MSSEAAYFPDALAGATEVHEPDPREPAISPEIFDRAKPPVTLPERFGEAQLQVPQFSDETLLEQIGEGNREALSLLFQRHARAVRNVACRILRNEAEADDLVQDIFLYIFRKAALFKLEQGTARSWIFQVAYHRGFDRRRHLCSRRFYASQELEDSAVQLADPREEVPFHAKSIEGIFGKKLRAEFNECLTPEQRETIQLYFFEGYSLQEIAQLTGRSIVNVRSYYYRGLNRLRKIILPEKPRPI
jgi:RNA polymerase sigma-70 factor, ECF subfamily